jgi:hypothetical protein
MIFAAREAFGRPILVTSGRRCEAHNLRVGGAARSRHLIGCAADNRPPEGDNPRTSSPGLFCRCRFADYHVNLQKINFIAMHPVL